MRRFLLRVRRSISTLLLIVKRRVAGGRARSTTCLTPEVTMSGFGKGAQHAAPYKEL